MMIEDNSLTEKKLRGSGGYVFAKVTQDEQKKGNLGGPELFLAGVGRLNEDRFSKYYCNKCEKEFQGSPRIDYEKPNEDLGEGVTLIEKGEYRCTGCSNTIAHYRKFDSPEEQTAVITNNRTSDDDEKKRTGSYTTVSIPESHTAEVSVSPETKAHPDATSTTARTAPYDGFISIQSLIGMTAYDSEAMLLGRVSEIGLRRSETGDMEISMKISKQENILKDSDTLVTEVLWKNISKIGDIVLLGERIQSKPAPSRCGSCGHQNEQGAVFCEECGKKLT
ncbi:MAG TPA: zinc-ribbon domain-containing protein [Candidatus Bathyarchaeia archaeon]|nr:zinc-ribbon domain-containing protein [Candidatus Bathyarchaeia archaeon]